ncbi:NADP-dependent oxidoreductase [Psychrobacter sp. APC 3426]|uniref:NADP-dependent oxidoreductase n=1 Tax=Psychrobacter TaxID=497 RepID=UPI00191A6507|nr:MULTISPECIES: NADP-dependent oxidoreductase [Psychrobacter]MDN3397770.1 NADP-dependent oxidoreductase [Psychrobacter sp. APC 3426]
MQAYLLHKAGGIENLILSDVDKPKPKANELLIEVKAISINPVDVKIREMPKLLDQVYGTDRPLILGWDIAGVVTAIGDDVTNFKVGDKVFGLVNFPGHGNAYAEYVDAPAEHLVKIPNGTSFAEAAATTLAALTALQVLSPRIKAGDKVLIHAGSGGVGHFAIQIAKDIGAYVISTSSADNKDFVLSLGADEHIDYETQDFEELVSDLDFVLDAIGGDVLEKSLQVTKDGKSIISLPTPQFSDKAKSYAKQHDIDIAFFNVTSNGDDMQTLKEMLEKGTLKPHVFKTFAFTDLAQAHRQVETNRTVGKVVVEV